MVWDAALVKAGAAVVYWVYDDGTMFLIHKVTEGYLPFNMPIDVSGSRFLLDTSIEARIRGSCIAGWAEVCTSQGPYPVYSSRVAAINPEPGLLRLVEFPTDLTDTT